MWPSTSSYNFQKEGGKATMVSPILLLGSGGVWPWPPHISLPERRKGVSALLVMRSGRLWSWPPSIPPRRKEGRKPWTLPLSSREVEKHDGEHPHTISKRKEGRQQWSLPFSSWEVGGCCHGHPTSLFQKEEVEEAMTFAHLLFCAYDPWPSSPRGKEGRQPWSLPF